MSVCTCNCSPCTCCCLGPAVPCTNCDRDRKNNVWVEGVTDENGNGGICMLDTMTRAQIVGVLEVNERARADLLRVTSNPELLHLASIVKRLPTQEEGDKLQTEMNNNKGTIPFYSVFRGIAFPFAQ